MDHHDSLIWKCVHEGHHELRHFGEICQGAITNLSGWLVESQLHWEQCHMPTMVFCCKRESISSRRVFFIVVVSSKKNTRQKGDATNFYLIRSQISSNSDFGLVRQFLQSFTYSFTALGFDLSLFKAREQLHLERKCGEMW